MEYKNRRNFSRAIDSVFIDLKQVKMKHAMIHPPTDNFFGFVAGIFTWSVTSIFISLLNVNVQPWIPPIISVFAAFAGGFFGMWGKDVYKQWKQNRGKK